MRSPTILPTFLPSVITLFPTQPPTKSPTLLKYLLHVDSSSSSYHGCYQLRGGMKRINIHFNNEKAIDACYTACKDQGYAYFGFECPRSNYVSCNCVNKIHGVRSPDENCSVITPTASHCSGPFVATNSDGKVFNLGSGGYYSLYTTGLRTITPLAAECATTDGVSAAITGQALDITCDVNGMLCRNWRRDINNTQQLCKDYQVRYA